MSISTNSTNARRGRLDKVRTICRAYLAEHATAAPPFDAEAFVLSITRDEHSIGDRQWHERVTLRKQFVAERVAELRPHLKGS